jgi:hypothetical protein
MPILPDYLIGLRLALKARFLLLALWLLIAAAAVIIMGAQFSGRQPATVALDIGLSMLRLTLPLVVVMLAQELLTKEFDRRYYLTSLTYPRPRHYLYLGRMLAILTMVVALLAVMAIEVGVLTWQIGKGYDQATPVALGQPYLITLAFITVDLFVVTAMAAFLAIVATTPSFILIGTLGFMIAARSFSSIIGLLERERYVVTNPELYQHSLGLLGYLLPDLAVLDVRMITLYSTMEFLPTNWPAQLISVLAYALALIGLSIWLLQRKRFA